MYAEAIYLKGVGHKEGKGNDSITMAVMERPRMNRIGLVDDIGWNI